MHAFWGEFLGTLTLILLGNGVVACVSLKGSYGEGGGWLVVTTGWGLAVLCAVLVALGLLLFFHRDWWLRIALDELLANALD